ncbi:MAG: MBL fold metallo-hydrolase [Polyangiaceae bacterium]|nr:MBL fold metallo-hydrolase [Polyangiaceae bacterium]
MGRFDHLATTPARGPKDMLRWKVVDAIAGKNRKDPGGFRTPTRPYDRDLVQSGAPSLTWIGHASFLLSLGGARVLVDPIWRDGPGPLRRLAPPGIPLAELPPIDAVLVTHNHRDHLDTWTLSRLGPAPVYVAPIGHRAILGKAGAQRIVELDWWESTRVLDLEITLVPSRHWSMRHPWDRNDALWGGYLLRAPEGTAYHSGDTAFFEELARIGERAGGIDWAMLPIGAYEPRWFMAPQHMNPEEAIEASRLLGARRLVAMHWGTYKLTDEPVGEPPERARAGWIERGLDERALWILDVGETRSLE